jgi:hypothetical protein
MKNKYVVTPVYDADSFEMFQDLAQVPEFVKDAAKHLPNFDASESLIFARQLETIKNKLYEKKYEALKGRGFVPFSQEYGLETDNLTYRLYDRTTLAVLVSNYATDFPLVTASAQEFSVNFFEFGNAYGYSMMDLRKAAKAGVELSSKLSMSARDGHELAMDDAVAFGVPQRKTFGLLNHPNIPLVALPNGNWPAASADDILEDLNYLVTKQMTDNLEIYVGDTLIMSVEAKRLLETKFLNTSNGSNISVLDTFKKQNPGITVDSWSKLKTASAAGAARVVFYKKSEDVMEFVVGKEFEIFPPEQKGMMISYPCISRFAGLVLHYPTAANYADNAGV